mmetsp:Transcript_57328/g.177683  ORF Transcript_57328/g.177683 Transcript_57328/m.177683 type:complete len:308 (+) Transcript_57328:96-1019(+)
MAAAPSGSKHNPLAVAYPSPMTLLQYPLFATNVKILCETDGWRARKQSSLATTILALRLTYQTEGMLGLYRGAHLYLLHQFLRDALRFLTDCGLGLLERWDLRSSALLNAGKAEAEAEAGASQEEVCFWGAYRLKLALKYLIDAACYPLLLASTRAIILREDAMNSWQRMCFWCQAEGSLSLFGGLTSSLVSTAFDEVMDWVLEGCVERCSAGSEISGTDKLLLKACSASVASVFTAPINYVGVIQRCQSYLPGLLLPSPLWGTVRGLPWLSSFYQLLMFGGILALNVKLIKVKLELESQDDDDDDE